MVQRAAQRWGYRPRASPDLHYLPVLAVPHHHPARVTRQPLRRSRGNVRSILQQRLADLGRICQDRGVHMDHDLVPLPGRTGVELVTQRCLGQQGQGIRLLLRPGRRLQRRIGCRRPEGATPLVERLAGRVERAHEQRPHLRRKSPPKHHGAVTIRVDVHRAARMLAPGIAGLRLPIYLAPPLHDALHVDRCAGTRYRKQPGLGLRGRDAGQRTDLGIEELTSPESRRHGRQRLEGAGHSHTLASGARGQSNTPREPLGAGAEASVPAAANIEFADERQEAGSRSIEVGGELGDLVAQAVQLRGALRCGLQRGGKLRRAGVHDESSLLLAEL
jgi:hypothetical protein